MAFELTDEQRLLQETVRRFVDDRILPNAIENDIEHRLDTAAIDGLAELGLLGIVIPEEYGGAGLDFVCEALACEEIERGEAAFRTLISVHVGLNSLPLLRYATEEQKQRWLVPQAHGQKLACCGSTGELFFQNVEVPAENLIGEEGQGFEIAMYALDQGRFTVAAGSCGVIRACLERSVEYARQRETFGQAIGKYQFVQDMIAEMVLAYETSKLLVMQAAWMKNEGLRNTRETSLAKWHATESAFRAAHLAIQVHGAYGYSAEYGLERYFRNSRAPIIYEGTTQVHKMMQAENALGYRQLNGRDGDVSPLCSWAPALSPVHARA